MQESQTAFVVMRTRQARAAAATGLLHADGSAWKTEGAPSSNEIIWGNVATPAKRRFLGGLASWAALIAIMVFFLPILAALQQLVNLEGYAKPGNWAQWILDAPVLGSTSPSLQSVQIASLHSITAVVFDLAAAVTMLRTLWCTLSLQYIVGFAEGFLC